MDEMNWKIRRLFLTKKAMEAEHAVHEQALREDSDDQLKEQCSKLMSKISFANSLLLLLNAEQEFLIRRHLIDGLPWSQLVGEHTAMWYEKDERTLKRIQARGMRKMAEFIRKHTDATSSLLDD